MLHHHDPKVASALIAGVLPALVQAITGAGESLAIEVADGEKVNIRHRTQAQQVLMFALADYLTNSACDHEEDHIYEPLRPYELADFDYARQWFADLADDDGDTEPIYTVAERPAETVTPVTPEPPARKPIRTSWMVSNDTELTEEGVGQILAAYIEKQLNEMSIALAPSYAPMKEVIQGVPVHDLESGAKAARRAIMVSFLSWLQTDDSLQDAGTEIALLL